MMLFDRNMFPENLIRATFQHQRTDYRLVKKELWKVSEAENEEVSVMKPFVEYKDGLNILGNNVYSYASPTVACNINST